MARMEHSAARHQLLSSPRAPRAVGPYAPAVKLSHVIYCSGQVGVDPETGQLVAGLEAQVRRICANLEALLGEAGSSLEQVVRTTVYLTDMDDLPAFNEVYAECFAGHTPARTTVQVSRLPLGATVEIEATAYVG